MTRSDPRRLLRRSPTSSSSSLPGRCEKVSTAVELLAAGGFRVLTRAGRQDRLTALGPTRGAREPVFWQLAGWSPTRSAGPVRLRAAARNSSASSAVHVPSFSGTTCVYKVMGAPERAAATFSPGPSADRRSRNRRRPSGHNRYLAPTPGPRFQAGAAVPRCSGTTAEDSTRSNSCAREGTKIPRWPVPDPRVRS